jgi:acetyl esterase/lipase
MHGRFFTGGDKSGMSSVAQAFASRGHVATSIKYRLLHEFPDSPGAIPVTFPSRYPSWLIPDLTAAGVTIDQYVAEIAAAVADQGMAVNWLANNAATYNVDPNKIMVGGYSAGAVSSLLLGFDAIDGVDADVAAITSFAGGTFGLETAALDSNDPPTFLVHGTDDTTVPYAEYLFLQPALNSAGVPYGALILNGVGHGVGSANMTSTQMFTFLESHLVPEPSSFLLAFVGCGIVASSRHRRT